jgi:hypothetical protein
MIVNLDIGNIARARKAIDAGIPVAALLFYIETIILAELYSELSLNVYRIAVVAVSSLPFATQWWLVWAGFEQLCRNPWRVYVLLIATLLFFVITGIATAFHLGVKETDWHNISLLDYYAVMSLALAYPVVKVILGIKAIRAKLRASYVGNPFVRWLFGGRLRAAIAKRPKLRLIRATPWIAASAVTVLAMIVSVRLRDDESFSFALQFLVKMLSMPMLIVPIASLFLVRGLRHMTLRAPELRMIDPRAPVLILRQFRDDQIVSIGKNWEKIWSRPSRWFRQPSFEELIAEEVEGIGPPLIIGAPGESLPPLGAARDYLADPDWKSVVGRLIKEAALVVVILGETENLLWEFRTAIDQNRSDRVVLIVPPIKEKELQVRWQKFAAQNGDLIDHIFPQRLPPQTLIVIFFSRDNPTFVYGGGKRTSWDYELAIRLIPYIDDGKAAEILA